VQLCKLVLFDWFFWFQENLMTWWWNCQCDGRDHGFEKRVVLLWHQRMNTFF
jgi:hypothetical protein